MENKNNIYRVAAVLYASCNYDISLRQVYRKIIEDALLKLDKEVEIGELSVFIESQYSLLFSYDEIQRTLTDNKYKENFSIVPIVDGCKYKLSEKRKSILLSKNPAKTLPEYVDIYTSINGLSKHSGECILRFMYSMYTSNLDSIQRMLYTKRIENIVPNENFTDEESDIINGFLDWDVEEKNIAIFNVSSYAIEYCMITNKKDSGISLANLRKKKFYLDTNIIYRAIGINGEDRKKRTHQFLNKLLSFDSEFYITRQSDIEFEESINIYIKKLRKADSPAISSKVYTEYVTYDDIWRYYHLMAASRVNFTVDLFNAYLKSEYKSLIEKYHVIIEDDRNNIASKEELESMASQIRGVSESKTFTTALYDAKNIKWIESKRDGRERTIFDAKHFLISSDGGLRYWDSHFYSKNVPIVIQPSQWLSIILRYAERTSDDFKSFVCFLNIKSREEKLSDEQIHAVLSGIAEMTNNVDQQRNLLEMIIDEDFKKGAKELSSEQISIIAKKSAEKRLQKQLAEEKAKSEALQFALEEANSNRIKETNEKNAIENRHTLELADKDKEVKDLKSREMKLMAENETLKGSLTEKDNQLAILQYKIEKSKHFRHNIWSAIWKFILLLLLSLHLIWYLLVDEKDINYMADFYRFVKSLSTIQMPVISAIITVIFTFIIVPIIKSIFKNLESLLSDKSCS